MNSGSSTACVLIVTLSAPRASRAAMSSSVRIPPPKVSGTKHLREISSMMSSRSALPLTLWSSRRTSCAPSRVMSR